MIRINSIVAACALVAGCSGAEFHSINESFDPGAGDARLIDAQQRAIVAIRRPLLDQDGRPITYVDESGREQAVTVPSVCSEPSPDALQATAAALSASGSQGAAAAQLALSSSSNAASFGLRTQTIQLLRDAFFRMCEAAQNDGLDSIAYGLMQRQYQDRIVALLAIEQLTGAVIGAQARLATNASANAGANIAAMQAARRAQQEIVDKAEADKLKADAAVADADTELKRLKGENPQNSDAISTQESDLEKKKQQASETEKRLVRERAALTEINKAITGALDGTIQSGTIGFASGDGARGSGPSAASVDAIAHAVRAITLSAINQQYDVDVCLEALRLRNHASARKNTATSATNAHFVNYCDELFKARVERLDARSEAIVTRNNAVKVLVDSLAKRDNLSADDAVKVIKALDNSTLLSEGGDFLARTTTTTTGEGETKITEQHRTLDGPFIDERGNPQVEQPKEGAELPK